MWLMDLLERVEIQKEESDMLSWRGSRFKVPARYLGDSARLSMIMIALSRTHCKSPPVPFKIEWI